MKCKKTDSKCNSKSCPYLQHLPIARRFDNWEAMFTDCPNLIEDKNGAKNEEDDVDFSDFDLDDDIREEEAEA